MSKKQDYIDTVAILYPADSQFPDTAEAGRRLLLEAMDIAGFNWRSLPEKVLRHYALLCQIEDGIKTATPVSFEAEITKEKAEGLARLIKRLSDTNKALLHERK